VEGTRNFSVRDANDVGISFHRATPSLASEAAIDLTQRHEDIIGGILSFDVEQGKPLWVAVAALVAGDDDDPADYI
jgi:hypothetical protein